MNPLIHTDSSLKKFGGDKEKDYKQYLTIHEKMDCSKAWIADNRHRVLTHTMFWVKEVMIPIFGSYITLINGNKVSVKDICEQHILEDYRMKYIPTPQDFIQEMTFRKWMQNGDGLAPSAEKLYIEKIEIKGASITNVDPDVPTTTSEIKIDNLPPPGVSGFFLNQDRENMIFDGQRGSLRGGRDNHKTID